MSHARAPGNGQPHTSRSPEAQHAERHPPTSPHPPRDPGGRSVPIAPAPLLSGGPRVPLIDLPGQYGAIRDAVEAALVRVIESQRFILGETVAEAECAIARYCDARFAVGCASGTDALILALMAAEIGPGDEVITTPYSFFATASGIWRLGAKPVFADILPACFNIDPAAVEASITPQTRAIIPVHLFGQCAEMEPLWRMAVEHRLTVIEDAAQAIGAEYRGRHAGVLGAAGCFSFFPTKNLGAFGDAGMVTTDDVEMASRVRRLRAHGMEPQYLHHEVGLNSRLDALQAAVLLAKLPYLEAWTAARQENARRYGILFDDYGLLEYIQLPTIQPDRRHAFHQYVVRVRDGRRDALRAHLLSRGIGCEVYYPLPLHLQPCFASLGYKPGSLPNAERAAQESLALPISPGLTEAQQELVVEEIARFFGRTRGERTHAVPRPAFLRERHAPAARLPDERG